MSDRTRTIVHVMRHGEVHNPDGILYGRLPDYHLSERGRAQAEAPGESCAAARVSAGAIHHDEGEFLEGREGRRVRLGLLRKAVRQVEREALRVGRERRRAQ